MSLIFQMVCVSVSTFWDPPSNSAMHCHKRGIHHVVHDMPQTDTKIEIVPVGEGIRESSAFVGQGPCIFPE